jgi:hypothetical protein
MKTMKTMKTMKSMKTMKLLLMCLFVFNLSNAQKKKVAPKTNQIEAKYIGKWSNDNTDLFYYSMGHLEITKTSITYYSGEFAEYLRYIIQGDRILIYYKNMEGSLKWNSNPKEDKMLKCLKPIGIITKENDAIVLTTEDDVCGRLPDGTNILKKHIEMQ